MIDFESVFYSRMSPEDKETELNKMITDSLEKTRDDVFNRLNLLDVVRLVDDYYSGLLAKHDESLGVSRTRPSGHGSTLTNEIEYNQVNRIMRLMSYIRYRPKRTDENGSVKVYPEFKGWWLYCIEMFKGEVDHTLFYDFPTPSHDDIVTAYTVFAKLLYSECFRGLDYVKKEAETVAAA